MPNYRFYDVFSEKEFQNFAKDIVQVRENVTFESFGDGRDNGMDGRFINSEGKTTVLQAKRYSKYHSTSLKDEVKKVKKLNPDRYILVLSYDSPSKKDTIMEMFYPYIKMPSDIIMNSDLNDYLSEATGRYKKVEYKYNRLWIHSTEILKDVIAQVENSEVYDDSEENFKLAVEGSKHFVRTKIYQKAISRLEANHVLLISGEPGMGKTMLANQLALFLLEKYREETIFRAKYYWVSTIKDLKVILNRRKDEEQKVIIFDDFWGSILFQESQRGREEEELGKQLENIRKNKKDYFILTTRHYILEQGLKKHEDIRRVIEQNKLECCLVDYSDEEKQKIFYEHIFRADINYEQAVELFKAGRRIIDSENYNLRVIDMFIDQISKEDVPESLPDELVEYLEKPEAFWNKIYGNLSEEAKYLYKVLSTMPKYAQSHYVEKVYSRAIKIYKKEFEWKEYTNVIAELEKTVIRTSFTKNKGIIICFQNPSMQEMIEFYLHKNLEQNKQMLLESCIYFRQAIVLLEKLAEHEHYDEFYANIMEKAMELYDTESIDIAKEEIEESNKYIRNRRISKENMEVSRIMDIYKRYKADICSKWKDKYAQFLERYLYISKRSPYDIPYYHIEEFPLLAINAVKENVLIDLSSILEIYKNLIMRNGLILEYDIFLDFDEKCCMEHIKKNQKEIEEYLFKYYNYRLCLAAAKGDAEKVIDYETDYDFICNELNINSLHTFWENAKKYESWIEEELEDYCKKDEEENCESVRFKETEALYWNQKLAIEDENADMNLIMSPEGEYILDFEYQIKKLMFNMGERQGLSDDSLADILTEIGCAYYSAQKKVWRREDIEELCFNKLHTQIQKKHLELLMNLNIFKKKDKWVYVNNTNIFFVIFLYQFFYKKNRNRERDYQQFFFDKQEEIEDSVIQLGLQLYCKKPQIILGSFLKMDEENFKKYIVVKWAKKFIEDNYAVEYDKLITNLLDTLDITIEIDKEGNLGGSVLAWYDIFDIIELDKNFYLGEILPAEFTKQQRDIILQANLSNEVSLQELYKLNLLRTMGVESKLMKLWKIILEYVEEEKDE